MTSGNPLLGTWRLVDWTFEDVAGNITRPLDIGASGVISYSEDGFVFVHLMAANRALLSTDDLFGGDAYEVAAAAHSHVSYFGTYDLNDDHVIHRIEACSFPNWVGGEQVRYISFEGDHLILTATDVQTANGKATARVEWARR